MKIKLLNLDEEPIDYSHSRILIPLSGGVTSAALLSFLGEFHPLARKPRELHLYHTQFQEHSPDTLHFVADCVRYAERVFHSVKVKIIKQSVNAFFIAQRLIPDPTTSPCTVQLRTLPQEQYCRDEAIDWVIEGFVRSSQQPHPQYISYGGRQIPYPLLGLTDDESFNLVEQVIGWYPAIYDIFEGGRRVFKFNNCLPCKNMNRAEVENVWKYFPQYAQEAEVAAAQIPGGVWGSQDVPDIFKCDTCERFN